MASFDKKTYLIRSEKTEEGRRKKATDIFLHDAGMRKHIEDRWQRNEKLLMGYINLQDWPYRSRISVKKIWEFVDTELARFFQSTISPNPPFEVNPVSGDDYDMAYKIKNLLLWQQENGMEFSDEWERFILNGLVYGFSPCLMDWQNRYGWVPSRREYRTKENGKRGFIRTSDFTKQYSGPGFEALDPYAIYLQDGTVRPHKSPYLHHRILFSFDELKKMERAGLIKNVDKCRNKDTNTLISTDFTRQINDTLGKTVSVGHTNVQWVQYDGTRDIEVVYHWFPAENYMIMNVAGDVTLWEGEIPYLNAEIPYDFWTNFLNLWHWCGWCTPEIAEDLQHEWNFLRNSRADLRNMLIMPQFLKLKGTGIFQSSLPWTPFGVIETTNMDGLKQLRTSDNGMIQASIVDEQITDKDFEGVTGLAGQREGIRPASRESATSARDRSFHSSIRMGHRIQRLLNVYKRILRKQNRYNRQFMSEDTLVRVLGGELKGYVNVSVDEVLRDYDVSIIPTLAFGNRQARREEIERFIGLFATVPQMAAVTPWADVAKTAAQAFDMRHVVEKIDATPEGQQRALEMGRGGTPPKNTGETAVPEPVTTGG